MESKGRGAGKTEVRNHSIMFIQSEPYRLIWPPIVKALLFSDWINLLKTGLLKRRAQFVPPEWKMFCSSSITAQETGYFLLLRLNRSLPAASAHLCYRPPLLFCSSEPHSIHPLPQILLGESVYFVEVSLRSLLPVK